MEFIMSNVVVKEAKNAYKGFLSVDSLTVEHPRFDGGSMTVTRELIRRKDCVSILPFDAISGKVMLVEQFRVGAIDDPRGPFVFELVAGIIDEGETAEQAARRELKEETGISFILGHMIPMGTFYLSPGGCNEQTTVFLAPVLLDDASIKEYTAQAHGCANEGEDIKVHIINVEEAMDFLSANPCSITTMAVLTFMNSMQNK